MMMNLHRRTLSSSSFSLAAGEARSLPRPRLEDDPREALAPDPSAAFLSLAPARSHLSAPSPGRGGHSRPVDQGGCGHAAAQGLALLQVPTRGGEAHEVSYDESDRGSDDDESLLPPPPFDDEEELQLAINDTFEDAQEAGQRGRGVGGKWHNMMSEAMNAVDVMNYNPNVPVDPEYRCHFTHDWVHEPVEWNGCLYSGAALRVFLNEQRTSSRWIDNPFTRELISASTEPTPRPEVVAEIAAAYERALEQYEQSQLNNGAPSALIPSQNNPAAAAAPAGAALAAPGRGRGRGRGDPDRRPAIGSNFSSTLEGMHALSQVLQQAKHDGWENSLGHGKCKTWIRVNNDGWFDQSLQGILSNFKKVAATEIQKKMRRAKNEARAMLAPGAHAEDESGAVVEDFIPRYVTLFGEYFDWKENSSRTAIDATNRQERRTIEGDALGHMGTLGLGQPPPRTATTRPSESSVIASRALTAQENDNGTTVHLLSTTSATADSTAAGATSTAHSIGHNQHGASTSAAPPGMARAPSTGQAQRRTSSSLAHLQGDFDQNPSMNNQVRCLPALETW